MKSRSIMIQAAWVSNLIDALEIYPFITLYWAKKLTGILSFLTLPHLKNELLFNELCLDPILFYLLILFSLDTYR